MRINPSSASFLISEDCNLACKYCFELNHRNHNHMTEEVAIRAVEYLYENAIKNIEEGPTVGITMFGGEPLLKPDILDAAVRKCLDLREKTNIDFSFTLITNGTLMSDKIKKQFMFYNENNVNYSIQLSVDSLKEYHDINRVQKNGKGSFDIINKNIPSFKEIAGTPNNRNRLHVHGSLNDQTISHMFDAYKFFTEVWKIPAVWFLPIEGDFWTKEHADIYEEQLTMIAQSILEKIEQTGDWTYLEDYAPLNKAFSPELEYFSSPCGAGRGYCSITASGDIYPCHQYYFTDRSTKTGNIWDGIDHKRNSFFENYSPEDIYCSIDKDCKNTNCYRCIASYYERTGSSLCTHYGFRCDMASAERKIMNELRKAIESNNVKMTNLKEVNTQCTELQRYFHSNFNEEFKKIALAEVGI